MHVLKQGFKHVLWDMSTDTCFEMWSDVRLDMGIAIVCMAVHSFSLPASLLPGRANDVCITAA